MEDRRAKRCAILTDFNIANFKAALLKGKDLPLEVVTHDYAQWTAPLLSDSHPIWEGCEVAVVWVRLEAAVPSFRVFLETGAVEIEEFRHQVGLYCDLLVQASPRARQVAIVLWDSSSLLLPESAWQYPRELSSSELVAYANTQLVETMKGPSNVVLINPGTAFRGMRGEPTSQRLWYLSKTPYSKEAFESVSSALMNAYRGFFEGPKKLVIVDADNTLWGGVVGEDGWANLRIGGHDPVGEAFEDFQKELKRLRTQGVLLGLASKNYDETVVEAFSNLDAMPLRLSDFSARRINWADKATSIREIVEELNLGLQSVVFFDDSPHERDLIRTLLPDVIVPEFPQNPLNLASFVRSLDFFKSPVLTAEDSSRAEMYKSEQQRAEIKTQLPSEEEWVASLQISVEIAPVEKSTAQRSLQLLNKTNQMNLRGMRYTAEELTDWVSKTGNRCFTVKASDRFGDYGLIGLFMLESTKTEGVLRDFVLSCRALGRGIEEAMIDAAVAHFKDLEIEQFLVEIRDTGRNKAVLDFFSKLKFDVSGGPFWVPSSNPRTLTQSLQVTVNGIGKN